jgi:hypothetical protein
MSIKEQDSKQSLYKAGRDTLTFSLQLDEAPATGSVAFSLF